MTHSVNSPSWLLAVTQAYSRTGKSIEHAAPENAGMITIEECHCMPILPCLHIVSCPFVLIARGLNDAFYATPRPFPQTNQSQTGKAITQMQLASEWNSRRWKDTFRLTLLVTRAWLSIHLNSSLMFSYSNDVCFSEDKSLCSSLSC